MYPVVQRMERKFPSLPPISFWRKPDAATPKKTIRTPHENAIPQPAAQARNFEQRITADFLAMKSLPESHPLRRKIESKIALKAAQMEQLSVGKEITDAQAFRALWIAMAHTHQGQHPLTRDIQKAQEQLLMESLSAKALSAQHGFVPRTVQRKTQEDARKRQIASQDATTNQRLLLDGIGRGVELASAMNLIEQNLAASNLVFESGRTFPTGSRKQTKALVISQEEIRKNHGEAARRAMRGDLDSNTNNSFDSNIRAAFVLEKKAAGASAPRHKMAPAILALTMEHAGRA